MTGSVIPQLIIEKNICFLENSSVIFFVIKIIPLREIEMTIKRELNIFLLFLEAIGIFTLFKLFSTLYLTQRVSLILVPEDYIFLRPASGKPLRPSWDWPPVGQDFLLFP